MGLWAVLLNRRMLVLTTERLLILQVNSRQRLLHLKSQIRLGAIKKVQRGLFNYVRVVCHEGRAAMFMGIKRADKKALRQMLAYLRENCGPSEVLAREHLCAHCFVPITKICTQCPECTGEFKSATKAGLLSLLFPGLGDLYLGHRGLAAFEIMGAVFVWFTVQSVGFVEPQSHQGEVPPDPKIMMVVTAVIIFVFMHGWDALVTAYNGRKGLYPQPSSATHSCSS